MNATQPEVHGTADIVRACYTAYEKKDRALLESLLAPDFTRLADEALARSTGE